MEPLEARILQEVRARVAQRPRHVLPVHRIVPNRCLVTERAERLEVPLERHHIERLAERAAIVRVVAQARVEEPEPVPGSFYARVKDRLRSLRKRWFNR